MNDTALPKAANPALAPDAPPLAQDDAPPPAQDGGRPNARDALVERWWEDHFPGSPVAQSTAAWNHAFAAKEELKRRLKTLIEEDN